MWKISVVFILVAASATFFITSSIYQNAGQETKQRTFFDESGKLHVMGIILEESTLRDAEKAFRSRADSAIFLYPLKTDSGKESEYTGKLEAYFPSIADHSKVLLTMEISPEELEAMRQRSSAPRIYPNGVIRMNLSSDDILAIQKMTITELTLIPSIQLTEKIIHAQFGKPSSKSQDTEHIISYTFPKLGLTASINDEDKDKLRFTNSK